MPSIRSFYSQLLLCILIIPNLADAHTQTDFNDNGISEMTYINFAANSNLNWFYKDTSAKKTVLFSTLGKNGDHIALAKWSSTAHSFPAIVRKNTDGTVSWIVENDATKIQSEILLGTVKDLFIAGSDIDGSGAADAIAVEIANGAYIWKIKKDPFNGGTTDTQSVTFGIEGDVPFFFSSNGTQDLLAVLRTDPTTGAQSIISHDLLANTDASFSLGTSVVNPKRPIPVRSSSGSDRILLYAQDSKFTNFSIFDLTGTLQRTTSVIGTGDVIVGDFVAQQEGEEVAVKDGLRFRLINPFTHTKKSVVLSTTVPVDEININSFGAWGTTNTTCRIEDPYDGLKVRFIWKPRSDTQKWAVAVLPNRFTGASSVKVLNSSGITINELNSKGCANPDSEGPRCAWIAPAPYTGQKFYKEFGAITLKIDLKDGSCSTYLINTPHKRVD